MPCEGLEAFDAVSICGNEPAVAVRKKKFCAVKNLCKKSRYNNICMYVRY